MTSDEFDRLQEAERLLKYAADHDHYCENRKCTVENPECADMHLFRAAKLVSDLLEPAADSLHPTRAARHDPERIYLDVWRHDNQRHFAVNGGFTLLEHILCPEGQDRPERVTFRDAQVAASVVQWLGTNCGHSLVVVAEQRIEKARATRAEWDRACPYPEPAPEDPGLKTATMLLAPFGVDKPDARFGDQPTHYIYAVRQMVAALRAARKAGSDEALAKMAAVLKGDK